MTRLSLRTLVVGTLLSALTSAQARKIFDDASWRFWLLATSLVCAAVVAVTARLAPWLRLVLGLAAVLVADALAIRAAHGQLPGDLLSSFRSGAGTLLSGRWPSATTPIAFGFVVFLAALTSAITAYASVDHWIGPARLLPSLTLLGAIALFAAQAGPPSARFLVAFVALSLAVLWCAARDRVVRRDGDEAAPTVRQPHRVALLCAVALIALPVVFAGALGSLDRFDPRYKRADTPQAENDLSPLTVVDQLRTRTPDTVLFETTGTPVSRWRLAGLNRYDGRAWMAPANLRQASTRLVDQRSAADAPGSRSVQITVKDLEGQWLPTPSGRTFEVSVPVLTDGTVSSLLSTRPVVAGLTYRVVANELGFEDTGANTAVADGSVVTAYEVGFTAPSSIDTLASQMVAGVATDRERAEKLASVLRDTYALDAQAPAGHSAGLLELFLTKSKRGRREQFVAGYAMLAHSIGLPVRISVGFAPPIGSSQVMSSSAIAWPEVAFQGIGWQAFDPVPATEGRAQRGTNAQAPNAQVQTPPPTTAPPIDATTPPATTPSPLSRSIISKGRVIAIGLPLLLVIGAVAYVLGILDIKKRQRTRRSQADTTNEQVVGAFLNGTDLLMDLGVRLPRSATDRELVVVGAQKIQAATELAPLADMATEAAYSDRTMDAEEVELANEYLRSFEIATASVPRKQLLLSKLSMRSVRKGFGLARTKARPPRPPAPRRR